MSQTAGAFVIRDTFSGLYWHGGTNNPRRWGPLNRATLYDHPQAAERVASNGNSWIAKRYDRKTSEWFSTQLEVVAVEIREK
jgi:hypothetical protein